MVARKSFINAQSLSPEIRREINALYHRMLPYGGSFYDTTTQATVGANLVNTIGINTQVLADGVEITNSDRITFNVPGWFVISFSAQFTKASSNSEEVDIWLRKNGSDVDWSNTIINLAGSNAENVAAWDWAVRANVGDYYQIVWSSPAADVEVLARAAQTGPVRPAVPSIIVNVWPVFGFSVTS